MMSVIGKVCKDQLTKEVTETNYISVMANGGTDVSGVENETVYCRFLRDGRPVNCLVGHMAVEHPTEAGEFKLVICYLLTSQYLIFTSKRRQFKLLKLELQTKRLCVQVLITPNLCDMTERNSQLQDMLEVMSF